MLYPDQNNLLPGSFHNRATIREAAIGRISSKNQILLNFTSMTFMPRYYGTSNIFITPDLYRDVNMPFVRILKKIGFIRGQNNLL